MGWKRVLTEEDVKKKFIPPVYTNGAGWTINSHAGVKLADAASKSAYAEFRVPGDFYANGTLKGVIIPAASGNIYFVIYTDYASNNEPNQAHSQNSGVGTETVVMNWVEVLSTRPVTLTALSVGDYVGCWFNRVATNVLDTVEADVLFLGFLFEYD